MKYYFEDFCEVKTVYSKHDEIQKYEREKWEALNVTFDYGKVKVVVDKIRELKKEGQSNINFAEKATRNKMDILK